MSSFSLQWYHQGRIKDLVVLQRLILPTSRYCILCNGKVRFKKKLICNYYHYLKPTKQNEV